MAKIPTRYMDSILRTSEVLKQAKPQEPTNYQRYGYGRKHTTAELIDMECENIKNLLLAKNKAYGDSAVNPVRIFSRLTAEEQINVRIDDKISRLMRGEDTEQVPEDTEQDLIGYLIMRRVVRRTSPLGIGA